MAQVTRPHSPWVVTPWLSVPETLLDGPDEPTQLHLRAFRDAFAVVWDPPQGRSTPAVHFLVALA